MTEQNLWQAHHRSSSVLVDNIAEGIHIVKCKYGHDKKIYEECRVK